MLSWGAGGGCIELIGVFSLVSPPSRPQEGREHVAPAECREELISVGFCFVFNEESLLNSSSSACSAKGGERSLSQGLRF